MGKGMNKAERLDRLKLLYCQRSFSDVEMAERLGVDRTTVYRDRIELEREHPFVEEEGRYRIDRRRYISNVRLNMTEALSLYLAAGVIATDALRPRKHSQRIGEDRSFPAPTDDRAPGQSSRAHFAATQRPAPRGGLRDGGAGVGGKPATAPGLSPAEQPACPHASFRSLSVGAVALERQRLCHRPQRPGAQGDHA